jgi:ribosomal protein S18 acetylase RimI-like enzyme
MHFEQVSSDEILVFRQAMLWPDKPLSHVSVIGDDTALHLCLRENGAIRAAGSFFREGDNVQLRKLAVHPDLRGMGIGRELIQAGADTVQTQGARTLWCDARVESLGFYEQIGFSIEGDVYFKSGKPYRKASIELG